MKTKVVPYYHINEKALAPPVSLTDEEALIRALDIMDFYASLISQNSDRKRPSDDVHWIELKYLYHD